MERIRLGTGVVGAWSRSAGALAMAAATLNQMSGARFILGLGASTPQLVEGLHDIPYAAPLDQLRKVVTQVRELLAGNRVPLSSVERARPLRLAGPIQTANPNPSTFTVPAEADVLLDELVVFGTPDDMYAARSVASKAAISRLSSA